MSVLHPAGPIAGGGTPPVPRALELGHALRAPASGPGAPVSDPAPDLRELSRPSATRWVAAALTNWAEMAGIAAAAAWIDHPLAYFLGALLVGTRQHALSLLAHDTIHYTAGPSRRVNDWLGCLLAFWPLHGGMDGYRSFHLKHHRTLGTPEDPEHAFKTWSADEWATPLTPGRFLRYLLLDVSGANFMQVFRLGRLSPPETWWDRLGPPAWWLVANVVAYQAGQWWLVWFWWWAYFTGYWASFRWRGWCEHQATTDTHRLHAGPLARFLILPHNTWLHWEHHLHPTVPCWNLPAIRARVRDTAPAPIPLDTLAGIFLHAAPTPWGVPPPAGPASDGEGVEEC